MRDTDLATRERIVDTLQAEGEQLAKDRGLGFRIEPINADPPIDAAPEIMQAIKTSAEHEGLSRHALVSRAYHDSLFIARKAPTGMIFVPSKNGVSHKP
ncbi:MAG: hypothetical protein AAF405_10475 [Pseudomonadota bacterium]